MKRIQYIGALLLALLMMVTAVACGDKTVDETYAQMDYMETDLTPYVTLGQYKGLTLTASPVTVSEASVEAMITNLINNYSSYEEYETPVTDRLTEIEDDAFEHCDGLTEIHFPQTLRRIGDLAFRGCRGLRRVSFAEKEGWYVTCRYHDSEDALDLSDPERNARLLVQVDFDDGPNGWYRK